MATLMRCTTAHWQGDIFIPEGALRPEGHREVIAIYFEPYATEDAEPPKPTRATTRRSGS